ncbi:hypothetical protein D9M68_802640 [compost metagenome]
MACERSQICLLVVLANPCSANNSPAFSRICSRVACPSSREARGREGLPMALSMSSSLYSSNSNLTFYFSLPILIPSLSPLQHHVRTLQPMLRAFHASPRKYRHGSARNDTFHLLLIANAEAVPSQPAGHPRQTLRRLFPLEDQRAAQCRRKNTARPHALG